MSAGPFLVWLGEIGAAIDGRGEADVACGTCTACCRSGQFVLVGPEEQDALDHIPPGLLFPAPHLPGHHVLGYDAEGCCPLLGPDGCTVYAHRPRTCRTYDCRVFAAADVRSDKPLVAERAAQWEFEHPTPADQAAHDAVRRAADWLESHGDQLPEHVRPPHATAVAVLAVQVHAAFLDATPSTDAVVAAALAARG
jgi:Fe-S-cluster containining protein